MKAYRGSRVIAPLILNLDARWSWVVNFTPRQLYPPPRERTTVSINISRYCNLYMNIKTHIGPILYTRHLYTLNYNSPILLTWTLLKCELLYIYSRILMVYTDVLYCFYICLSRRSSPTQGCNAIGRRRRSYVTVVISLTQAYPKWGKYIHTGRFLNNM
jgi:hypothetical protein